MAKVKIQGNASGTGILTVTAPDTSTDRTITLPDATGTLLTTADSVGGATGVDFNDNVKAKFGTGDDLEIYHDGSNSYITDAGTGNLYLRASNAVIMQSADGGETLASFHDDNLCRLYYDNSIKLETTATGIAVTGSTAHTEGSISNTIAHTYKLHGANGTGGSPHYCTYAFQGDDNTGMYSGTANTIKFATAGSEKVRIQSGGGISFNGDTAAANALDDYEEGTCTLTLDGASNYSGTSATYVKVGNMCTVAWYTGSFTSTAVLAIIRGFPFTSANNSSTYTGGSTGHNTWTPNCANIVLGNNTTVAYCTDVGVAGWSTAVAGTKYFMMGITYRTT